MTNQQAQTALRAMIDRSGLSVVQFAKRLSYADRKGVADRTVRHWLAGTRPIPRRLHEDLRAYLQEQGES